MCRSPRATAARAATTSPTPTTHASLATTRPTGRCTVKVCMRTLPRPRRKSYNLTEGRRYHTMPCRHSSAVCIPGLADVSQSSCNATGGNDTVNGTSWGCLAGYYVAPAPQYCAGMFLLVSRIYWSLWSDILFCTPALSVDAEMRSQWCLDTNCRLQRACRACRTLRSHSAMRRVGRTLLSARTHATLATTKADRPRSARV
jgi:hypothetical protein